MAKGAKILVVDDDPDFVAGIEYILAANQYEVVAARNKDEGLAKAKSERPDLIVLDVMMGKGAEGVLFARKIRKEPEYADCAAIPIMVMTSMREKTGFWFPGEPKHPVLFPIDEIVEKPLKPDLLLEKIRSMLARSREAAK